MAVLLHTHRLAMVLVVVEEVPLLEVMVLVLLVVMVVPELPLQFQEAVSTTQVVAAQELMAAGHLVLPHLVGEPAKPIQLETQALQILAAVVVVVDRARHPRVVMEAQVLLYFVTLTNTGLLRPPDHLL